MTIQRDNRWQGRWPQCEAVVASPGWMRVDDDRQCSRSSTPEWDLAHVPLCPQHAEKAERHGELELIQDRKLVLKQRWSRERNRSILIEAKVVDLDDMNAKPEMLDLYDDDNIDEVSEKIADSVIDDVGELIDDAPGLGSIHVTVSPRGDNGYFSVEIQAGDDESGLMWSVRSYSRELQGIEKHASRAIKLLMRDEVKRRMDVQGIPNDEEPQ